MNPHHFLNRYVHTFPIILPSIRPESAIDRRRFLAYSGLHPRISETSAACTLGFCNAFAIALIKSVSAYTVVNLAVSGSCFLIMMRYGLRVFKPYLTYGIRYK